MSHKLIVLTSRIGFNFNLSFNDLPVMSSRTMSNPDRDLFCNYPFMQMVLHPTGTIAPCCWNQKVQYGNLPEISLEEAWNSQSAQDLRAEFLSGNPKICAQEMKEIGCHLRSRREFSNELDLSVFQKKPPVRLDVRLNGKCNLQCIMCDVWTQPNQVYDRSDFWTLGPKKIFPHLREIDVLGGEPFVQADTFRLIKEISKVNSSCKWAFVTNANYQFKPSLRSFLDLIEMRWIQVSLDSLNPHVYETIRVGGKLQRTLATFEKIREYQISRIQDSRGFLVRVSMCVQKTNWEEVPEFLSFCSEKSVVPSLQFAYMPAETSLLSENLDSLKKIYLHLRVACSSYAQSLVSPILSPIRDAIRLKAAT